jgi:hypothetical protein
VICGLGKLRSVDDRASGQVDVLVARLCGWIRIDARARGSTSVWVDGQAQRPDKE